MRTISICEQTAGRRTNQASGWPSRVRGLTRVLAGILFLALLHSPVQSLNATLPDSHKVTLAWDSSPDAWVAGYALHHGTVSGNCTVRLDVGANTSATVSNLMAGVIYYFIATAYTSDGQESLPSNEVSYMVPVSDNLPTIELTSPVSGDSYAAPATINLAASVTANGHTIAKVQFYNGATLLGEASSPPYSFAWSDVSAGDYSPTANAIYDAGSTVTSSPVGVIVTNLPPTAPEPPEVGLWVASTGQIMLTVRGLTGHTYEIEATDDFTAWTPIGSVTLGESGSLDFADMNAESFPKRFYRARDTQP
jgi:hypothetical protein